MNAEQSFSNFQIKLSLIPHKLSGCCQVPVLGNQNNERGICSKCQQPCTVTIIDDGERDYLVRMAKIKHKSVANVTRQVIVTGFNVVNTKITAEFKDRSGLRSYCTINNTDFFKWASANSYLALLPEVEYVDGNHWDKQYSDTNRQLNVTERVRFYQSIDKPMLENYLNEKLIHHYVTTT